MATQPAFTRRPADDSFKQLVVREVDHPGQFNVENGPGLAGDDFDAEYVAFGAYFGRHGPYVFAAAPELRDALQQIADLGNDGEHSGDRHARCRDIARAALAKIGATS